MKRDRYDAIIIGGGITGAAIAYSLAKNGCNKTLLVEMGQLGGGSTAKAAALLSLARDKPHVIQYVRETYSQINELASGDSASLGFRRVGGCHVASSDAMVQTIYDIAAVAAECGIRSDVISNGELETRIPWINTSNIMHSIYYPEEAYVDTYLLTSAFMEYARYKGCEVCCETHAEKIRVANNSVRGVETDSSFIEANNIIVASGIWSNLLLSELEFHIPFTPVRSQYWMAAADSDIVNRLQPICIVPDAKVYTRPDNDNLIFGWREHSSVWVDPHDIPTDVFHYKFSEDPDGWENLAGCVDMFSPFFDGLSDIGIKGHITGFSGYAPDGLFNVGPVNNIRGLYVAAGCSGMGVAVCGGIGKAIAELICQGETDMPLAQFSPDRFGSVNAFSADFMTRCAKARSGKVSG